MTNQQKKAILNQNFNENYEDYFKIVQKIRNNRKKHLNLDIEDILTIIYINIEKRLNKLDDIFFEDLNQFRALFINTTQSQIMWGNSDISQHSAKLTSNHANCVFEDAEGEIDVTNTPLRINGERVHQQEVYEDDFYTKLQFVQEQYPQLLTDNVDMAMWRLVIKEQMATNAKFSSITTIPLTTSAKLLKSFKSKIKYIYQNHSYIRFKPSLTLLADMHPVFQKKLLKAINGIETKHNDVYIVITEGFTPIREQFKSNKETGQKGLTSLNYGLGAKIALFDDDGPLEFNSNLQSNFNKEGLELLDDNTIQIKDFDIKAIKKQFTNQNFIKNTQFINIC